METIGRIGREHFLKGKTIKEIARDAEAGRWTVELDELLMSNAAKAAREHPC